MSRLALVEEIPRSAGVVVLLAVCGGGEEGGAARQYCVPERVWAPSLTRARHIGTGWHGPYPSTAAAVALSMTESSASRAVREALPASDINGFGQQLGADGQDTV